MSKVHQTTYNAIFQHPIAQNLQWHDVRSMLNALTDVTEEHNGNLKFMRNGEVLMLHPHKHKDLSDIKELMQIRYFLERSSDPIWTVKKDSFFTMPFHFTNDLGLLYLKL